MPSKINCYFIIPVCGHFNYLYSLFFLMLLLVGGVSVLFDWQKYSFTTGFSKVFKKIITNLKMKLKSQLLFLVWIVNKLTRGTYMQKASCSKQSLATIVETLSINSRVAGKELETWWW